MKNKLNKDGKILLNEQELKAVKDLNTQIVNLKVNLANAVIQAAKFQEDINNYMREIDKIQLEYVEEAKKVVRNRGIDIDDPAQGQWTLDIVGNTLFKV